MTADNMLLILEMKRAEIDATILELRHVLSVLTGMDPLPVLAPPVPVPATPVSDVPLRLVANTTPSPRTPKRRARDHQAYQRDILAFFDAHPEPQRLGDVFRAVPELGVSSGRKVIAALLRTGALIKTGKTASARFSRPSLQQDTGT